MKMSEAALLEIARVHGYDVPMFPNELSADKNVRALVAAIADFENNLPVTVATEYSVSGGDLRTVILVDVDGWNTAVYFDKWGFVADNMAKPLPDQASFNDAYNYVVSALSA